MERMQAAVFKGNGVLELEEIPIPLIKSPTEVLLKIKAASICGSDIHGLMVPPAQFLTSDIVMGHEFFGEIVECGADAGNFKRGDCVVVNPAIGCKECYECKHGLAAICNHNIHYGQTCDGGFAQYAVIEASQLYLVPPDINPDIAAQAEPLACIMGGIAKLKPRQDESVLLYGAGPIGLMYIKVLKALGVHNLAVCAKGEKRIAEAKRFGAEIVIDAQKDSVLEMVMKGWGKRPDVIIDAVGTGDVFTAAVELINSSGRILLFGFNKTAMSNLPPSIFCVKELTVMGSRSKAFSEALEILNDENLGLDELVSHRISLAEIQKGMELMRNKEATRVIVYPNGSV